jgi:hypothetical protein
MLAISGVLVFAGYTASSSSAASLPMGFAIERAGGDKDWLGLSDPANTSPPAPPQGKWAMVHSKLVQVHSTWVNAHVGWGDLADGAANGTYAKIEKWVSLAEQGPQPMNFLLSVDYKAPANDPSVNRGNACQLPQSTSKAAGNAAIDSMRKGVRGLYYYLANQGDVSELWPNIRIEIGTEANQDADCDVQERDAQLWWDVVNGVAKSAKNADTNWYPGLGIVAGGVFTNSPGNSANWGISGSIGATAWLEEAFANDRGPSSGWDHDGQTYFSAYGVHTAHCAASSLEYRTRWDCKQGVQDRIQDVRQALTQTNQPVGKEIEVTALIVTQPDRPPKLAGPTNWTQGAQAADTSDIWGHLVAPGGLATQPDNPLTLVIWNHLVDSGQGLDRHQDGTIFQTNGDDFGYGGWMTCADDPFCGPDDQNSYTGKQLFQDAQNWTGIQSPW